MADIYAVNGESLTAIADAIREKTGGSDTYKPGEMAEGVGAVYDAGHAEGFAIGSEEGYEAGYRYGRDEGYDEGYMNGVQQGNDEGYAAGRQAEHDAFWDAMQQNGARRNYSRGFGGVGWTKENFRPKYDIIATGDCQLLFSDGYNGNAPAWDLAAQLEECGVALDLSQATSVNYAFNFTNFTRIGVCDFSSATAFANVFGTNYKLVTIDKIIMPKKQTSGNLGWFGNSSGLENVTFEGEIMLDGMNMSSHTKLTHDSLMSIINHLKDYSGTGTTRTVTLGATNLAKLTAAEKQIATGKGWTLA